MKYYEKTVEIYGVPVMAQSDGTLKLLYCVKDSIREFKKMGESPRLYVKEIKYKANVLTGLINALFFADLITDEEYEKITDLHNNETTIMRMKMAESGFSTQ